MDYASWTSRASQFLRSITYLPGELKVYDHIEPPVADKQILHWLKSRKCPLPVELNAFLALGSRHCCIRYRWLPPATWREELAELLPSTGELIGGADFCNVLWHWLGSPRMPCRGFAEAASTSLEDLSARLPPGILPPSVDVALNVFQGSIARLSDGRLPREFALMTLANNDRISLIPSDAGNVVAYIHPGSPGTILVLSDTFDEFLGSWEQIAYLEPTLENLRIWLDPETGRLNPPFAKAQRFRELLKSASLPARG